MLLKEVYNREFLTRLAAATPKLDQKKFLKILAKDWAEKSLKQRMRAVTLALDESLPTKNYSQQITLLKKAVSKISKDKNSSLALIIFPDFVEVFGIKFFDLSMNALEFFTEFGSSEFAVRQFIKKDKIRALHFLQKWTKSKNHHVRRLASEACRPRLPWGEALQEFKKNPAKILPILEALKFDETEYVRKSVANNLNDISKDHPQIVLDLLTKWKKEKVSERLIKYALRGLLKSGNKTALELIGISNKNLTKDFSVQAFALQKNKIKTSENLIFDFALENQGSEKKFRLEYAVFFIRKNGSHSKKIFQITTKNFAKGVFKFSKKHSFRDLSTRKHYAGEHLISLVVNGIEIQKLQFELI